MAESRYKVKAIGAPFDIQYSSCSNIKPKNFDWVSDVAEWEVHIDHGLLVQPNLATPKIKRYGWICESRFIVPEVYNFILQNYKVLFENYYNKIFTCDQDLIKLNPNFVYCPNGSNYPWVPKHNWGIFNKTKL
jgi:hypothetical protein